MTRAQAPIRIPTDAGFSLLELIMVLGILSALAAIGIPRYGSAASRHRADLIAQRIVADLQLARGRAQATSASQSVVFDVDLERYTLPNLNPLDPHQADYTVKVTEEPYKATLTSAQFGGDGVVIFSGWGLPDSGGTLILQSGAETRTVVLDALTGEATVQ